MAYIVKPAYAVRQAGRLQFGRRLFLPLTEGSGLLARDYAGRNRGTLSGTLSHAVGAFGKCLDFSTAASGTAIVDCGSDASLDDLGPLTFAAWIRPRTVGEGSAGRIFSKGGSDVSGPEFVMSGASPWRLQFIRGYVTTNLSCTSGPLTAPINEWHRAAVTWDGTNLQTGVTFWIDGRWAVGAGGTDGAGAIKSDAANPMVFGNRVTVLDRAFDGLLDAPAVWGRVLTLAEILADFHDAWASVRPRFRLDAVAASASPAPTTTYSPFGPPVFGSPVFHSPLIRGIA